MKKVKYDLCNQLEKGKISLFTPTYTYLYTPKSNHQEVVLTYQKGKWCVEKINENGNSYIPLHGCVLSFEKDFIHFSVNEKVEIENYEYVAYFNSLINQDQKRCLIHNYNQKNYGSNIVLYDRKFTIFTLPTTDYYEMVLKLDDISHEFIVNTSTFKKYQSPIGREIDKESYVLFANASNPSFYERFQINDQVHFEFPMVNGEYHCTISYTEYNPSGKDKKIGDVSVFAFREADTCMIYDINGCSVNKKTRMTGTNPWGFEVAVDSTGIIIDANTNVAIPENGYVISGVSEYYSILKEKFKPGAKVVLNKQKKTITLSYLHVDSCLYLYEKNAEKIQQIVDKMEKDYADYEKDLIYKYYHRYQALKETLEKEKAIYTYSQNEKEKLYHLYCFDACFNKSMDYYHQLFKLSITKEKIETRACWHEPHEKTLQEVCEHLDTLKASNFNELIVGGVMTSGVIFKSSYVKMTPFVQGDFGEYGDDYLKCLIAEAKKRNIKIQISSDNFFVAPYFLKENFAQYKDLVAVDYNGDIGRHDNGEITLFFDPVNQKAQQLILNIYKELLDHYEISGLQLDYIRYCIGNDSYLTSYGYNEDTTELFKKQYHYDGDIHELVKNEKIFADFCQFRRDNLTDFVGKVKQLVQNYDNIQLTIAVVSDYQFAKASKLQDWVNWCKKDYIDGIYLMAYHIGAEPVYDECIKAKELTKDMKTFVVGGIAPIFNGSNINLLLEQIEAIKRAKIDGISLFAFHSFQGRPDLYFYFNNHGPFQDSAIPTYAKKEVYFAHFLEELKDKCYRIFLKNNLIEEKEILHLLAQVKEVKNANDVKDITYIANPKARFYIDQSLEKLERYLENKK